MLPAFDCCTKSSWAQPIYLLQWVLCPFRQLLTRVLHVLCPLHCLRRASSMGAMLGKTGVVESIRHNGDLFVRIDGDSDTK